MKESFDMIPFEEWDIRLDNTVLDQLIRDDISLNVDQLSKDEKASIDVIVVGREHGSRSTSALVDIIETYKPQLLIHEASFHSEHDKEYRTIVTNGLFFDTGLL